MDIAPDALDLMTRTLLGEADDSAEGYQAVANVIKNRVNSRAWGPNTKVGPVINARRQFAVWNNDPKMAALQARVRATPTSDPRYQRAAMVLQQVFNDQLPDNTGGATHYYAPKGMPNGQAPDWARGQNGQMIGSQIFYRLPLTAANTAGTAVVGPSTVTSDADTQAARQYLASLSAHPTRPGDTANLNPAFATRLASAIKQARSEGLPVTIVSGFREPGQTGSAYDAGGNSSHTYGLASDVGGLDGPNGRITKRWAQIAEQNGLHNPYGVGDSAEFNHWQLPELPLEQSPAMLASLKAAKATGDWSKVWAAYSAPNSYDARKTVGPSLPPAAEEVNPANVPAPNAQPVSAAAPASATAPSVPGAGFVGPGSDKYSVVSSMTTGTSHNPQLTTAADWGHLGGAAPVAAPAAPAAAPATTQPALDTKNPPAPPERPGPTPPPGAPVDLPPSSPIASVVPNWGAATPIDPKTTADREMPAAGVIYRPPETEGAPSMGFPAVTNPFGNPPPADQTSMNLPGSMLASAQNLINLLFPPNRVG